MGKPWFGRKRIGWGWRPVAWQGWAITLLIVVAAFLIFRFVVR